MTDRTVKLRRVHTHLFDHLIVAQIIVNYRDVTVDLLVNDFRYGVTSPSDVFHATDHRLQNALIRWGIRRTVGLHRGQLHRSIETMADRCQERHNTAEFEEAYEQRS